MISQSSDRLAHKFNSDLLLDEKDRQLATKLYPKLIHVLDNPHVRQLFEEYDGPANRAKRLRLKFGYGVILSAVLALFGVSAEPFYGHAHPPWPSVIGTVSAIFALIGIFGALWLANTKFKNQWICNRLMTERLRQFHFQTLVAHIPTILDSMKSSDDKQSFLPQRSQWLASFIFHYKGHLGSQVDAAISNNPVRNFWLHDLEDTHTLPDIADPDLQELFDAYETLRFDHQIDYCDHMLSSGRSIIPSTSQDILQWTKSISLICIFIIFVTHLIIAFVLDTDWISIIDNPGIHVFVIWVAIIALATRACEEGLQPSREVERYREYLSSLLQLANQFRSAEKSSEKINVMKETERISYQEMRGFLATNKESRFII
jgi:hypothetical protein